MTTIDETIAKLEGLEAKATPGPWEACAASGGRCVCGLVWSVPLDVPLQGDGGYRIGEQSERTPDDAALIVALRNEALPALRAAREELRAAEERATRAEEKAIALGITAVEHMNRASDAAVALDQVREAEREAIARAERAEKALAAERGLVAACAKLDALPWDIQRSVSIAGLSAPTMDGMRWASARPSEDGRRRPSRRAQTLSEALLALAEPAPPALSETT